MYLRQLSTRLFLVLGGLCIVFSGVFNQARSNGQDFFAYYKAGHRFLNGVPFYVPETSYAFKYSALSIFYFVPFAWMPYDTARWVFASLHIVVALATPWLVWILVSGDLTLRRTVTPRLFFWGLCFAFIGSLRFVDGELRNSNFGMFMTLAVLLAALAVRSPFLRAFTPWILGLGAVVKVHMGICYLVFRGLSDRKTRTAIVTAGVFFLFIPGIGFWPEWWRQMQATGSANQFAAVDYNLQGFHFFASRFFKMDPHSLKCLVLAVPFGVLAWFRLPRFTLDEAAQSPARFFLCLGVWILLALMASPLPWQHSYSFLWAFIPVVWCCSSNPAKYGLAALTLFLGLSPRDLIGRPLCGWLEANQSVFIAALLIWLIAVFQSKPRGAV